MSLRINQNVLSTSTYGALSQTSGRLEKSIQKLSSGLRINSAADDPSGLAMSQRLKTQFKGLDRAVMNSQDAISYMQTAESALNETPSILQRMRELAVQSSSDTLTNTERGYLNQEFIQLKSEVDRIVSVSEFNGQKLLDGSFTNKDIQIGANNSSNDRLTVTISSISTTSIGIDGDTIDTKTNAQSAIDALDDAIDSVNSQRSAIGAYVNRLEHTITNLKNAQLNTQAAESLIRDVDVGEEMANFTKTQILVQAGTSILAQANATPGSVLRLFR